jgi:hypothetical protein
MASPVTMTSIPRYAEACLDFKNGTGPAIAIDGARPTGLRGVGFGRGRGALAVGELELGKAAHWRAEAN